MIIILKLLNFHNTTNKVNSYIPPQLLNGNLQIVLLYQSTIEMKIIGTGTRYIFVIENCEMSTILSCSAKRSVLSF